MHLANWNCENKRYSKVGLKVDLMACCKNGLMNIHILMKWTTLDLWTLHLSSKGCVSRQVTTLLSRGRSNVLCITFLIDYCSTKEENDDIKLFFSLQKKSKVIISSLRGQVEQIFFKYNTDLGNKKLIFHPSCPSGGHVATQKTFKREHTTIFNQSLTSKVVKS